jgi:uroporphyrin-III C-methyltransferase
MRVHPVALVGAGPGDPELITVKGLRRLQAADVVVYDRLIDPRLLDEAPAEAERIFVGKAAGFTAMGQRAIEAILVESARAGKRVVRLKGGDPFVFGRGAEEMTTLAAAGIQVEIVPGITSATAVPGSAGIPVTHRELASVVTIVAGHEHPEKEEAAVDWDWLARGSGTLVVLMGLERVTQIADRLIAGGRSPKTPVAVISAGTMPKERRVIAELADIGRKVEAAGLQSPAIIVIGEVVRLPETLAAIAQSVLPQAV